jgi:hypothetical protein
MLFGLILRSAYSSDTNDRALPTAHRKANIAAAEWVDPALSPARVSQPVCCIPKKGVGGERLQVRCDALPSVQRQ